MTELSRPTAPDRIGPSGLAVLVEASEAERRAIAARLGLPAVGALRCSFRLRRIGPSVIEGQGELHAIVDQICVLTLDTFTQVVEERFIVHFVPSGTEDDEPEPDSVDQIPYEGSAIDPGEATVEQLALALDPYPRKPGATLPTEATDGPAHPFAALAGRGRA